MVTHVKETRGMGMNRRHMLNFMKMKSVCRWGNEEVRHREGGREKMSEKVIRKVLK